MGRDATMKTLGTSCRGRRDLFESKLLTEQIAIRLESELDEIDGVCAPTAAITAAVLRERGFDAWVECGTLIHDPFGDGLLEEDDHAYVRLGDVILDPVRAQFGEPVMRTVDDRRYRHADEAWGEGLMPPRRPSLAEARGFIESWWGGDDVEEKRASLLRVLGAFHDSDKRLCGAV